MKNSEKQILTEQIKKLEDEKEKLNEEINTLQHLNLELQMRVESAERGNFSNCRTINLLREKIEHYEKMFDYLTGGKNENN